MIYLDTSVALAQVLAEDRVPPAKLWREPLVTSRLLEYEAWTRIHALGLARSHGELIRQVTTRLAFLELVPPVLARALEPFPVRVRTLDALHLASIQFLRDQRHVVELASYDQRLLDAGRALGVPVYSLE